MYPILYVQPYAVMDIIHVQCKAISITEVSHYAKRTSLSAIVSDFKPRHRPGSFCATQIILYYNIHTSLISAICHVQSTTLPNFKHICTVSIIRANLHMLQANLHILQANIYILKANLYILKANLRILKSKPSGLLFSFQSSPTISIIDDHNKNYQILFLNHS